MFKDRVLAGRVAGLAISVCMEVRELHEHFNDGTCVEYDRAMSALLLILLVLSLFPFTTSMAVFTGFAMSLDWPLFA